MEGFERLDKNNRLIELGDTLRHEYGSICKVVFNTEILAIGLVDENGEFDFMSEWVAQEWEIINR